MRLRGLIACLAWCATLAWCAADVTGKWKGVMGESGRDVVFQLRSEGSRVSGTMSGPNGEPRPITQGELSGENIALTVASEWQGNPVKLLVKGKVAGGEMRVTVESEGGDWSTELVLKKE
ncbi:MAG: hypothetical protein IT158_17600 [Bryobacterales bacterium]|nr:hypothetical protein [Bryobacterales bacterium]